MNITKNKIFKNHKKALLLVTAVLCQLCVIPLVTGSNGNTQFSIKAVNQDTQEVIDLLNLMNKILKQGFLRLLSFHDKMGFISGNLAMSYDNYLRNMLQLNNGQALVNTNNVAVKSAAKLLGSGNSVVPARLDYSKMAIPMLAYLSKACPNGR